MFDPKDVEHAKDDPKDVEHAKDPTDVGHTIDQRKKLLPW
jgi:hypothetical protein